MERRETRWYSDRLGLDMPLVAYGTAGIPLLMFPTAGADYLEYERFLLIDAIKHHIEAGVIRAYSINSVNRFSLLSDDMPNQHKAQILNVYDEYVMQEVLPWIRKDCGDATVRPWLTGASLGALLTMNTILKHPTEWAGCIAMSGSYDIRDYLHDYYDEAVYYNNPVDYLPRLNDPAYLEPLRNDVEIVVVSGQGAYESPSRSLQIADLLRLQGIKCRLDLWGYDVNHDWPWWRKMLDHYINTLFIHREGAYDGNSINS